MKQSGIQGERRLERKSGLPKQGPGSREATGNACTGADQSRLAVGAIACLVKVNQKFKQGRSGRVGRIVGRSITEAYTKHSARCSG